MAIKNIQSQGKIERKNMWPSFETAVWLYDAANIFLIGALVVGVISTAFVVWMGNVKGAELEKEAALARLETEKIKEAVSWRVISPKSASELVKILSANPGSVNLRYTDGDPEALFFAIHISEILKKSNWKIAPGAFKPSNTIVFGICLPDSTGDDAQKLRNAFSAAKIPFSTDALPKSGVSFSISTIQGAPILMIGSKKPALP